MRQSVPVIFVVSVLITIGMWFERFVIIVTSLHRAFIPSEWGMFFPTPVDMLTFTGSFGTFITLYLLFMKFLPQFAMSEIKNVMPQASPAPSPAGGCGGVGEPGRWREHITHPRHPRREVRHEQGLPDSRRQADLRPDGEFATPADIYHAAEKVRDAGYEKWDVYAPFPIHGSMRRWG